MDLCRVRFGMAGNQRCLVRHRVEGVGGVPDERAARFMPRGHLGAHMLYGLAAADKATELFALASIIDSLFDHGLTCAQTVGGEDHTTRSAQPGRCNAATVRQWISPDASRVGKAWVHRVRSPWSPFH